MGGYATYRELTFRTNLNSGTISVSQGLAAETNHLVGLAVRPYPSPGKGRLPLNDPEEIMRLNLILSVALAVAVCGCSDSSSANRSRNIKIVELEHSEIWSKGNLQLIDGVYAENFIGHFPAGTVRGRAGIRAEVKAHRTAFPDWTETVDDVIADGDRVVTRFTSRGTNFGEFLGKPATGKRIEISEACIHRFADGKIVELWVYPDFPSLQRQLNSQGE
jgi:steroid delta-isomerase-like uncharacterized protein